MIAEYHENFAPSEMNLISSLQHDQSQEQEIRKVGQIGNLEDKEIEQQAINMDDEESIEEEISNVQLQKYSQTWDVN